MAGGGDGRKTDEGLELRRAPKEGKETMPLPETGEVVCCLVWALRLRMMYLIMYVCMYVISSEFAR